MIKVEIDKYSGFCFGVIKAINLAEKDLKLYKSLYCLGDIVHNSMEVARLEKAGLKVISEEEYYQMKDTTVLIRAHGQPPEAYDYALKNNIKLIDATCPVVLSLQKRVKASYKKYLSGDGQLVIFGKKGHAEVIGLNGQIKNRGIIIEGVDDLKKIDYSRPVCLYSQTTMKIDEFQHIAAIIKQNMKPGVKLEVRDTICRQVANRVPQLKEFAKNYDIVLFVAGAKSSNGRYLFSVCREANPESYYISGPADIDPAWMEGKMSVGISGATSTPEWLMKEVAKHLRDTFG
jgi:4-hydroxy-3-methylbut-2-en-1-yl diphosphate reductase